MEPHDLETHIAVCNERYENLILKLDAVTDRLDKMNGRWWKVLSGLIGVLVTGLAITISYIWINNV